VYVLKPNVTLWEGAVGAGAVGALGPDGAVPFAGGVLGVCAFVGAPWVAFAA
jgi:hypothetical protein